MIQTVEKKKWTPLPLVVAIGLFVAALCAGAAAAPAMILEGHAQLVAANATEGNGTASPAGVPPALRGCIATDQGTGIQYVATRCLQDYNTVQLLCENWPT